MFDKRKEKIMENIKKERVPTVRDIVDDLDQERSKVTTIEVVRFVAKPVSKISIKGRFDISNQSNAV